MVIFQRAGVTLPVAITRAGGLFGAIAMPAVTKGSSRAVAWPNRQRAENDDVSGVAMMLDNEIVEKLNEQITAEAAAAQLYLQMSLWCEDLGLQGAGAFFRSHVSEEMSHRDRLVDYMIESDAPVALEAIPAPKSDFADLVEIVNYAYEHEQAVTEAIHQLAKLALDKSDFSTFNMLQWFIAEQREELMLFRGIVDYIRITGFTGKSGDEMVNMDKYLANESAKHNA